MKLIDYIRMAIKNLRRRKQRTFFTKAAITLSLMFIITVLSIGISLNKILAEVINSKDFNIIRVSAKNGENSIKKESIELNDESINKIINMEETDTIRLLCQRACNKLKFKDKVLNESVIVEGMDIKYLEPPKSYLENNPNKNNYWVDKGRFIEKNDKYSVVLSEGLANKIGGQDNNDLIGKKIELNFNDNIENKYTLNIVGILKPSIGDKQRDRIIVPIDVVYEAINLENNTKSDDNKVNIEKYFIKDADKKPKFAEVRAKSLKDVKVLTKKIQNLNFEAKSQLKMIEMIQNYFKLIGKVFISIGVIILIVSMISISNTMFTSVGERVKSIGILKALGASKNKVERIFIIEALIISIKSTVYAVIWSGLNVFIINKIMISYMKSGEIYLSQNISMPIYLVLICLLITIILTIISSIYPAKQASRMNVIDALMSKKQL